MHITDLSNPELVWTTRSGKKIYWLIPAEIGAPNFELRYVEIPPQVPPSRSPRHPHEHEVFVVSGKGRLQGVHNGVPYEVELVPGQAIFIPGNEDHQWLNPYAEPFGVICVIPKGTEDEVKPPTVKQLAAPRTEAPDESLPACPDCADAL